MPNDIKPDAFKASGRDHDTTTMELEKFPFTAVDGVNFAFLFPFKMAISFMIQPISNLDNHISIREQ